MLSLLKTSNYDDDYDNEKGLMGLVDGFALTNKQIAITFPPLITNNSQQQQPAASSSRDERRKVC